MRVFFVFMIIQQMHFYKHVQSRVTALLQHVSVSPVAIIRVYYNKNTISVIAPSGFIRQFCTDFHVLLSVHLSINLLNDQLGAQLFYFIIRLLQSSTCFEQRRAHHQEVKFY